MLRVTKRTVTLENTPDARRAGTFGLGAPEAYAQVGAITKATKSGVTRSLKPLDGTLPPGDLVDVDGYAYPHAGDPA